MYIVQLKNKNLTILHKYWIFEILISGPEGNRTPVRKPIPCSSTIIVCYLEFPPAPGNRHPDSFGSFMIRPRAQSFARVVSCFK